ncbi:MAG: TIGR03986 family CRISPR-associated RAMP protein [Candidatus Contendobacter sp.]|nr:TIGR03986 family CRISPR-associated RAMP protein [Candidatus Contendobacter sp.]
MAPPTCIDAPYNFVPLADWVHIPDWAGLVSHDLPFRDGLSGHLDLTITAHTPILVGQEQQPATAHAPGQVHPYQLPDGRYALPGTALKGMIRAVVEIASFSRMAMVDNQRLGVRDLTPAARPFYGDSMTKPVGPQTYRALSKAGWLSFDTARRIWSIRPCEYARVEHNDLVAYHGAPWINAHNRPTARDKYDAWLQPLDIQFDPGPVTTHPHRHGRNLVYRKASNLGTGATNGTLVFTGQPNSEKHLEFIFFGAASARIRVPDDVFRGFLDIHDQKTENATRTVWDDWRGAARVPVFYLEEAGRPGIVASLGLALMYKLAYRHSIHDAIRHSSPQHLDGGGDDLATLLFGRVGDKPEDCLRGRVTFHHAVADGNPQPQVQPVTILNGPKPTYYPNYIRQPAAQNNRIPNGRGYATFMDAQCKIRGWKRYPAQPTAQVQALTAEQMENTAVQVILHPLQARTIFSTRMDFHNLKPEELGALCWALTWGGADGLRHSLGMGKPFGFGQLTVAIGGAELRPNRPGESALTWKKYRDTFIKFMDDAHERARGRGRKWRDSDEIKALVGMADPGRQPAQGQLQHMRLTTEADNQFKDAKIARLVLPDYPGGVHPPTWAEQEAEARRKEEEAARAQAERERQAQEAAKKARDLADFEALPQEQKQVIHIEREFDAFITRNEHGQRQERENFVGILNQFAAVAKTWSNPSDRSDACSLLERIYEAIGWADPGKKGDKRKKQEDKRRGMIEEIRRGI